MTKALQTIVLQGFFVIGSFRYFGVLYEEKVFVSVDNDRIATLP
jgi:hypothetical protein